MRKDNWRLLRSFMVQMTFTQTGATISIPHGDPRNPSKVEGEPTNQSLASHTAMMDAASLFSFPQLENTWLKISVGIYKTFSKQRLFPTNHRPINFRKICLSIVLHSWFCLQYLGDWSAWQAYDIFLPAWQVFEKKKNRQKFPILAQKPNS